MTANALTAVVPPAICCPGLKVATYSFLFSTSYPTGGEVIDLSADFTRIYVILIGGNDTLADNGYKYDAIFDHTAAVTSTSVTITAHWEKNPGDAGGADIAFPEYTNTGDLHAVGALKLVVFGK